MLSNSRGRLFAGCLIGIACGLTLPFLSVFSAWVLPVTVIFALLWVWSGGVSVLVGAVGVMLIGSRYPFLGWPFPAAILLLALPGVLAAMLTQRRKPFFRAVGYSVAMQLATLLLLTAIAWLYYQKDLVDVITGAARGMIDEVPLARQHFFMLRLGQMGFFGENTGIDFSSTILSDVQLKGLIDQLVYTVDSILRQELPAVVLTSGVVTGALSYAGAAWVRVRRGDDPAIPFEKPSNWRLSANMIITPPLAALLCLGLDRLGMRGADSAYVAMVSLSQLLFSIQAVGALERRMKVGGMTLGKRAGLIVLALTIGMRLMPLLGMYSALFGSQGLVTKQIRKRMDGKGDE